MDTMKNIKDDSIELIVTDPPYGMSFRSNHRSDRYDSIHWDDDLDWLDDWTEEAYRILGKDSHMYMFCSFNRVDRFKVSIEKHFVLKNILIWEKNNTSMGDLLGDYAPKYEMILFATKGRRLLNGGRDPNILRFSRTGNKLHPTQKPEDLIEYLISKSSFENDTVYDPFIGSGTTAIAAMGSKRNYIGSEIDSNYYNIARKRIEEKERQGSLFVQ